MWAVLLGVALVQLGGAVGLKCPNPRCSSVQVQTTARNSGDCSEFFRCNHGYRHEQCTWNKVQVLDCRCKTCGRKWESSTCPWEQYNHKLLKCSTHDVTN
ncbi:hypothetical protein PGT21_008769 [Puccinia graminis f. sp. tritici]|uniref:Chitin-binding type-2 domain-containing protein n=1 Tax=Puccinia graminis f. sp. tritici TaxID=56615 RepID=A0A5B0QHV2_PUCGR|nr:hypothetical protein PGT21_008769 [Puccinia graminis f. sp. tritici]